MDKLTIAHISDLHLSVEHRRRNIKNSRRLLDHIMRRDVDHIVITGDIAANAEPRDLELARKLLQSYGLLDPGKLTILPGNHDIFGGVHTPEDILTFPRRCRHTDFKEKVKAFRVAFHETFERCLFPQGSKSYPFAKVLGDTMLVGANSVARYSGMRNPIGSNGEVEKRQLESLEQILTSGLFRGKRKIVLIHHHFSKMVPDSRGAIHGMWGAIERQTMKLRGKKKMIDLFERTGVNLVMHGHLHESREYMRKGVRFLNAGGAILGSDPEELSLNLVTFDGSQMEIAIHKIPAEVRATHALPSTRLTLTPEHAAA